MNKRCLHFFRNVLVLKHGDGEIVEGHVWKNLTHTSPSVPKKCTEIIIIIIIIIIITLSYDSPTASSKAISAESRI
jgi:hypothetical protein